MIKQYVGHFRVVTCCGDPIDDIDLNIDMGQFFKYDWADFDVADEYRVQVLDAACIKNYECQCCYDLAYHVKFDGYTETEGCTDHEN